MGEALPHHGFVSRIVTEAFRLEGTTVHYEFYPWARAYHVARNGSVDASIGWYRTEEREQEESKAIDVQRTGSDEQNLRKLLAGRVQSVVLSRAVGTRLLQALGGELNQRITFDPRPINSGPLHVIFPKSSANSEAWLTLFNRGLRQLKASGSVDRYALEH